MPIWRAIPWDGSGGRMRGRRRPLLPNLQSHGSRNEIRSRWRLCPPLGAGARRLAERMASLPWSAPPPVLEAAGVRLGRTYPHPVVDHAVARKRALAALNSIKNREDPPKSDFFADNGRSIGTKSAEQPVSSLGQHFAHAAGYQRGDIEQGARHSQTSRGGEIAGPPDRQKLLLELAQPSKG